jgi:hypothetical protein
MLLLDRKYQEIKSAILREEDEIWYGRFLEQKELMQAYGKLEALGVFPATECDIPF